RLRHRDDAAADRARRRSQSVRLHVDLDLGVDGDSVGADLVERTAELRIEMRAGHDEAIVEPVVRRDRPEDGILQAVLGAVAGEHGDDTFHAWAFTRRARPSRASTFGVQPNRVRTGAMSSAMISSSPPAEISETTGRPCSPAAANARRATSPAEIDT